MDGIGLIASILTILGSGIAVFKFIQTKTTNRNNPDLQNEEIVIQEHKASKQSQDEICKFSFEANGPSNINLQTKYELAKEIYSPTERDKQIISIIRMCLSCGQIELAQKAVLEIYYPTKKDDTLLLIIKLLCKNNRLVESKELIEHIYYPSNKTKAITTIIDN